MNISSKIKNHVKTSLTTIIPTKETINKGLARYPINPFPALSKLSLLQWQLFFLGLWMWILDSASFFSVSLTTSYLAEKFDKSIVEINDGIMYSLFTRVAGAVIFGIYNDMFSRKWTYVVICSLLCAIQLGTSFVQTFDQFLACRCVFGLILGASFSVGNITAVENINASKNKNSKNDIAGLLSGVFQAGYPMGYLIAQGATRGLVESHPSQSWRILFWFTSALCVPFIIWRSILPESPVFSENQKLLLNQNNTGSKTKKFFLDFQKAFQNYWDKILYQCVLMGAFCYTSHGSQDLFPTLLKSYGFSASKKSTINCVANVGCIIGGIIGAHAANYLGIRFIILCGIVIGCGVIYPWGYVEQYKICSAFWLQFAVQFGFANVPKYLHELSSYGEMKAFATIIIGFSYQIGTLVSAPASTIQSKIAAENNNNYSATMSVFLAIVFVILFVIVLFGIENRDSDGFVLREGDVDEEDTADAQYSMNSSVDEEKGLQLDKNTSFESQVKPETQYVEQAQERESSSSL